MNGHRYCLFGAAPDTGNLGVSALCFSTISGLRSADPSAEVVVFDHGRGVRTDSDRSNGHAFDFRRCGGFDTRRLYRRESLWNIRLSGLLGGLGNAGARAIASSDAVLDISGGDSFTDLYGPRRFAAVAMPKLIAIGAGRPLVLLPQTYGPFESRETREKASRIVRRSSMAWARDRQSFDVLRELAGAEFDTRRHRCGVDVAFGLAAVRPASLPERFERWVGDTRNTVVGINVSGLLYNAEHAQAVARDGLHGGGGMKASYVGLIDALLARFMRESDAKVALIPHVLTPVGHYESDVQACEAAVATLGDEARERVLIVPPAYDQHGIKWIIGQTQWFCGTRMHSTIAALSQGVPAAAIAYSPKTAGVFETCGQGDSVVDARRQATEEIVERLWDSWLSRRAIGESLKARLPEVVEASRGQMREIVTACRGFGTVAVGTSVNQG